MDEAVLQRLADNQAIRDVLARYARGVDRLDAALIRSCYHDGAVDHHGTFEGTADEFAEWVVGEAGRYSTTLHVLAQTLVEWPTPSPDVALVETYALAFHRLDGGGQSGSWQIGFRYVDRFERRPVTPGTPAEWRIAERHVIGEWLGVDPLEHQRPLRDMAVGRRDGTDPVIDPFGAGLIER